MSLRSNSPIAHFRRFFLRGLAVVLPATLTLWVLVQAYLWIDRSIAEPINSSIRYSLIQLYGHWPAAGEATGVIPSPEELVSLRTEAGLPIDDNTQDADLIFEYQAATVNSWWEEHFLVRMIGLVVAISAVYVAGRLVGGLVGRAAYRWFERLLTSLPVIKKIYAWIKQIVDFLFGNQDKKMKFNRVVAAEYPRRGIWSVGFQTGESMKSLSAKSADSVTVFIPSSPTPFTGYTITIPRKDIIELPISVEEAIGFAISGGVLRPPSERISPLPASPSEAESATLEGPDRTDSGPAQ
ncbi:MAG: DUF502 domain-containing protein [Phycisphaerales bacterium]|nr:DUF502 domain-containing protein [Phycisphaerales bacterium]